MENNLLAETNAATSSVRLQGGAPLPSSQETLIGLCGCCKWSHKFVCWAQAVSLVTVTYGRQLKNCSYVQVRERTGPLLNWIYTETHNLGLGMTHANVPLCLQASCSHMPVDFRPCLSLSEPSPFPNQSGGLFFSRVIWSLGLMSKAWMYKFTVPRSLNSAVSPGHAQPALILLL